MKPLVSIIMGSKSDYKIVEASAKFLNDMKIPFEMHAFSAHRTPEEVKVFALGAHERGIKVIIAAAGMAAHLPGVVASLTHIPVIGIPINASFDGLDALLAIVQMPPGIPVATVGVNGALNAAILALQILAVSDSELEQKLLKYKTGLKQKVVDANNELANEKFQYRV
jgi:5-(carboxyamino)imidazole ribonucleotide mutase